MAMTKITPVRARVRWDRAQDRPASLLVGERRFVVNGVDAVRDEMAAYPLDRGPRITFLLDTDAGQASLVFDARGRRWFVEAMEAA